LILESLVGAFFHVADPLIVTLQKRVHAPDGAINGAPAATDAVPQSICIGFSGVRW
jgi:hypothetical protein